MRKARLNVEKLDEKLETVPRKDKRKYRRARWKVMRAQVETSRYIRKIEFTEPVKRRLVEEVKDIVERVLEACSASSTTLKKDAQPQDPQAEAQGRRAQDLDSSA